MTTKLYRVFAQIRRPTDGDPGQVVEGIYTLSDNTVTITDHVGTPVRDQEGKQYSKKVENGDDHYVIAARLTKSFRSARRGDKNRVAGFSRPLNYPKLSIV